MQSSLDHLRNYDPDKYLLHLFVHNSIRHEVALLDVWSNEIFRVIDAIHLQNTGPHMGMIKLQWWRDEFKKIYTSPHISGATPLLNDLSQIIHRRNLSYDLFEAIITGREFDVMAEPATDMTFLYGYVQSVYGSLLSLQLKITSNENVSSDYDDIAMAYGLVQMVRMAPYHAAQGRCYLPHLVATDIKPHHEKMQDIVREVIARARHFNRVLDRSAPRYVRAQRALTDIVIRSIESVDYDIFHVAPIPFKELRVWWQSR